MLNLFSAVYKKKNQPAIPFYSYLKLGLDHLWLAAILVCFAFVISPMPIGPNDFWWHLKIGEVIYQSGAVPTTNMFSWSLGPDYPFFYGAWLAELLFYLLYKVGRLELVAFTRTFLTVLAFALVGFEAARRSRSYRIAGVVTLFACAMVSNNVEVRPQLWAWLPFIGFYILLSRYVDRKLKLAYLLLLCPLLMVFWVNVHGSFVLGFVLLGIFFAGEVLKTLLKWDEHLTWMEAGWIAVIGFLTGLSMLLNPRFIGIIGYVHKLMTDAPSQRLVVEWQPPAPDAYATVFFYASILLLIGLLAYARYKLTPTELLLIAAFMWLAWSGIRYVAWYGIVAMPILGKIISDIVKDKPWMATPPRRWINTILVVVLILPVIFVQPWFIERVPMPKAYWTVVLRDAEEGPLMTINTPVAAAEYLEQNPGGNLFNEMGYGSYLIWAVPDQGVFVDPRVELYPYEMWLDYLRISRGTRYNYLLDQYNVDRLLLHVDEQAELIVQLESDPLWRLEYLDEYSQIWVRAP
jgi:hypothetical protein